MPELPEVETVARQLESELSLPERLCAVDLMRLGLRNKFPKKDIQKFVGLALTKVARRSKYLLFWFGSEKGFLSHLGMTGHWRIESGKEKSIKLHDHIRLHFSSGRCLIYNDPRRFGFFDVFYSSLDHKLLKGLGPEPFSEAYSALYLKEVLKGRQGPIKNMLMNQKIVAGIGNIYASEILFRAGIKPTRAAGRVSLEECRKIVTETQEVLSQSTQAGGSSFDDFRHVSGKKGGFQLLFQVYNRHNEKCLRCGHGISRKVQAGRSTFWCAKCQK